MKTKRTVQFLLSIGLLVAFNSTASQISSKAAQAPDQPEGADRDGYADLAIGIPGRTIGGDAGAGMVGFLYGSDSGLDATSGLTFDQDSPGIEGGPEPGDHFGQVLEGGDFNGDGYMDLAIGVPGEAIGTTANAGLVHILYGSSSGITDVGSDTYEQSDLGTNTAEVSDRFGAALASGDFNLDGCDDLAIGVPGQDFGLEAIGVVNVMYGSTGGLTTTGWAAFAQGIGIQESPEEADNFGSTLAAGDFDGDGYHDLAIGAPNEALVVGPATFSYAGVVQVVFGSASGLSINDDELWYQGYSGLQEAPEDYDMFGKSLAAGDFDGDGRDDLAIGVPNEDYSVSNDGVVHILWGDLFGLSADIDLLLRQGLIAGQAQEAEDKFGWALAAGNFNGDDDDDLAIGVPGQDVSGFDQAGRVHVQYGSNFFNTIFTKSNPVLADDNLFGSSLAAGDIDGNGFNDLVIGDPNDNRNSEKTDSGSIWVYYSDADGVDGNWGGKWELDDIDATLDPEKDDLFGTAIVVLDEPHTNLKKIFLPMLKNNE